MRNRTYAKARTPPRASSTSRYSTICELIETSWSTGVVVIGRHHYSSGASPPEYFDRQLAVHFHQFSITQDFPVHHQAHRIGLFGVEFHNHSRFERVDLRHGKLPLSHDSVHADRQSRKVRFSVCGLAFDSFHWRTPFKILIDQKTRRVAWISGEKPTFAEVIRKENLKPALGHKNVTGCNLLNLVRQQIDKCGRNRKPPTESFGIRGLRPERSLRHAFCQQLQWQKDTKLGGQPTPHPCGGDQHAVGRIFAGCRFCPRERKLHGRLETSIEAFEEG